MSTTTLPIAHLDVPITRVDDKGDEGVTIVEGYAYVNATVPGDRYDLTRAAMEEATPDYMKWAAIREMHGPNAIGRCISADWDAKGCKIVAEIVDDAARKKVERGVLKAFSVGAQPLILRGRSVSKVSWREVSLVDRPKDEDCPFAVARFDDVPNDGDVTVEVEPTEDEVARGAFADAMKNIEPMVLTSRAIDVLSSQLYSALVYENADATTRMDALNKGLSEFKAYVSPLMERGETFIEKVDDAEIARAAAAGPLVVDLPADFLTRFDDLVTKVDALAPKPESEEDHIGRRASVGITRSAPAAAFKPLERTFGTQEAQPVDNQAEIARLQHEAREASDPGVKARIAAKIGELSRNAS